MGGNASNTTSGRYDTLSFRLAVNVSVFRAFRITNALNDELPALVDNHAEGDFIENIMRKLTSFNHTSLYNSKPERNISALTRTY